MRTGRSGGGAATGETREIGPAAAAAPVGGAPVVGAVLGAVGGAPVVPAAVLTVADTPTPPELVSPAGAKKQFQKNYTGAHNNSMIYFGFLI